MDKKKKQTLNEVCSSDLRTYETMNNKMKRVECVMTDY